MAVMDTSGTIAVRQLRQDGLPTDRAVLKVRAADVTLAGQECLSDAEHERLAGMHEGARPAFVTARHMLRSDLGSFMGLTPGAVPLAQQGTGRVRIDGFGDDEPPYFSVSHTGAAEEGIAAVMVTEACPIGIDIQQIDQTVDWRRLAQRRFPPEDWALLANMSDEVGSMLFFTLWSIREAFVKMEDGKLLPYLRNVLIDLTERPPGLAAPTPKGCGSPFIFFHFEPGHQLMIAAVAEKPIDLHLDCSIRVTDRRPDPLTNHTV